MLYRSCMNESEWGRRGCRVGEVLRDPQPLEHSMEGHATQGSCQRGGAPVDHWVQAPLRTQPWSQLPVTLSKA